MSVRENLQKVQATLHPGVQLVAVSKFHPVEALQEAYDAGQRIFGESHVQELLAKQAALPSDIQWHFIGHLQTNKVKYVVPFISLIHSVDSIKLLKEIDKQAQRAEKNIEVLLQLHIAQEETKYGFTPAQLQAMLDTGEWKNLHHVHIAGLMAMATNTDDQTQIACEFATVAQLFTTLKARHFAADPAFRHLSMGMTGDYRIAQLHGSTLVRIGTLIFGQRNY